MNRLPPIYFGWTGVDLFFVLSGYLIGTQIWRELQNTGSVELDRFLLRRGLRIWPLYFSFVFVIACEGIFLHRNIGGLWADATFLSNYFHHQVGGGWSLSTEEQFYILFPALILALIRLVPPKQMVWIPVAWLALLPVVRALMLRHFAGMPIAQIRDMMYSPIHTHSDGLAVGVLIAWVQVFKPDLLIGVARSTTAAIGSIALGAGLYVWNRDVFSSSSLGLIFGGMVLAALASAGRWSPLFARPFYVVSRLSYGVYLNHFGLLPILMKFLGRRQGGGSLLFFVSYLLCLAACVAFAAITFVLIEDPFLELRDRWLKRTVPPPIAKESAARA